MQVVLPSRSWYFPAAQRVHLSCSMSGLTVPGAHGVAFTAPTGQNVPTPQAVQSSALVIVIDALMRLPPGHGSAAVAPTSQYEPSRHPLHAVELLAG